MCASRKRIANELELGIVPARQEFKCPREWSVTLSTNLGNDGIEKRSQQYRDNRQATFPTNHWNPRQGHGASSLGRQGDCENYQR